MGSKNLCQGEAETSLGGEYPGPLPDTQVPDFYSFYLLFKSWDRRVLEREMGRQKGDRPEKCKLGKNYLGSTGTIKPFNIKAGKVLQNLVRSPFMGGKTPRVDTLLM